VQADKADVPENIFYYMNANGVGEELALLWVAWANAAEEAQNYKLADQFYQIGNETSSPQRRCVLKRLLPVYLGAKSKAEPKELLEMRYKQFLHRMAQLTLSGATNENTYSRKTFTIASSPAHSAITANESRGTVSGAKRQALAAVKKQPIGASSTKTVRRDSAVSVNVVSAPRQPAKVPAPTPTPTSDLAGTSVLTDLASPPVPAVKVPAVKSSKRSPQAAAQQPTGGAPPSTVTAGGFSIFCDASASDPPASVQPTAAAATPVAHAGAKCGALIGSVRLSKKMQAALVASELHESAPATEAAPGPTIQGIIDLIRGPFDKGDYDAAHLQVAYHEKELRAYLQKGVRVLHSVFPAVPKLCVALQDHRTIAELLYLFLGVKRLESAAALLMFGLSANVTVGVSSMWRQLVPAFRALIFAACTGQVATDDGDRGGRRGHGGDATQTRSPTAACK
jgi:hypothetical protein